MSCLETPKRFSSVIDSADISGAWKSLVFISEDITTLNVFGRRLKIEIKIWSYFNFLAYIIWSGRKINRSLIGKFQSTKRSSDFETSVEALWLMNVWNVWWLLGKRSRSTASKFSRPLNFAICCSFCSFISRIAFVRRAWSNVVCRRVWHSLHTMSESSDGLVWSRCAKILDFGFKPDLNHVIRFYH